MKSLDSLTTALVDLGFSQYEARSYVGLLGEYGQTAYALSKVTGVPQPKIYEALRKLIDRNAAVRVNDTPQRFAARPLDELLADLRDDFAARIDEAERRAADALRVADASDVYAEVIRGVQGKGATMADAVAMIRDAREKVYISAWNNDLEVLEPVIRDAEGRGVTVIVLAFGRTSLRIRNGVIYKHATTAKVLYPSHQNRHLGVIADGRRGLWGLSFGRGGEWTALEFHDRRLIGLLRNFIRHDIYVQKIWTEMGDDLERVFGDGLIGLSNLDGDLSLFVTPEDSAGGLEDVERTVG